MASDDVPPLNELPRLATVLRGAGYRTATFRTREAGEIIPFVHSSDPEPFYLDWSMENIGNGLMERTNPDLLHLRENVPREVQSRAREDWRCSMRAPEPAIATSAWC